MASATPPPAIADGVACLSEHKTGDPLPVKCKFPGCKSKPFKSWGGLLEHARNKKSGHGIPHAALAGTALYEMGREILSGQQGKRRQNAQKQSAGEKKAGAPTNRKSRADAADSGDAGGAVMEEDAIGAEDQVLLVMPGRKLGKRCLVPSSAVQMLVASGFLVFEEGAHVWTRLVPAELQEEQLLDAMPNGAQRDSMAKVLGKHSEINSALAVEKAPGRREKGSDGEPMRSNPRQVPQGRSSSGSSGLPPPAPKVTITSDAKAYRDSKTAGAKKQRQRGKYRAFPWSIGPSIDISAYKTALYAKVTNAGSRSKVIGGLKQFLSLFDADGASLEQFLEQLADTETPLMAEALSLNILDPYIPWTLKMMTAMQKVCCFFRSQATVRDDTRFANKMSWLLDEYIADRITACSKAASETLAAADEQDFEWLQNMAPAGKTKAAVQDMMRDLAAAAHAQKAGLPGAWKHFATVCMAGITFMAQCNSRPGLWEHLTTDTLHEMKELKRDYWTAIKGVKVLGIRGASGKYMCPGCLKAADVYCAMEGRTGNRFWLYKFPKLHVMLGDACLVYLPGHSIMSPTAMRQFWETVMHHDDGGLAEKIASAKESMCNAMDHGEHARDKSYVKGKARKVAADSKACTIAYYDGEIDWPTEDMLDTSLEARAGLLAAKFAGAKVGQSVEECSEPEETCGEREVRPSGEEDSEESGGAGTDSVESEGDESSDDAVADSRKRKSHQAFNTDGAPSHTAAESERLETLALILAYLPTVRFKAQKNGFREFLGWDDYNHILEKWAHSEFCARRAPPSNQWIKAAIDDAGREWSFEAVKAIVPRFLKWASEESKIATAQPFCGPDLN